MNVYLSCKVVISLEEKNRKIIFAPFGNAFLPSSKNTLLKGYPILYPLKQKDICDYNPICIM